MTRHLIKSGCLIDGTGAPAREDIDILFDERRILAIDGRDAIADADAAVIPAFDKVVLPGLVDAHVHICFDASCDPVFNLRHEPPPDMTIRGVCNARDMLMAGVTTIRTLGTPSDLSSEAVTNAASALEYNTVGFRNAVDAGAKIAMGSDAGTPLNDHGRSWRELIFMVKNGMSPMHALVAATKGSAELIDMGHDIGTLEPGKAADLIDVSGDPLSDISDIGCVSWVIRNGVVYRSDHDGSPSPRMV